MRSYSDTNARREKRILNVNSIVLFEVNRLQKATKMKAKYVF